MQRLRGGEISSDIQSQKGGKAGDISTFSANLFLGHQVSSMEIFGTDWKKERESERGFVNPESMARILGLSFAALALKLIEREKESNEDIGFVNPESIHASDLTVVWVAGSAAPAGPTPVIPATLSIHCRRPMAILTIRNITGVGPAGVALPATSTLLNIGG
ncbi:hypothetical protein K435DRAFT_794895 [Dendrothele bispora CBS 962.96]|uniref:Uncharacterized protein n=1 Tax=Dendrothele bispora (strain CBS 962.96) TaxID=1314807 RepID=A0A4S8MAI7_DENBC|nr:hypothetical protein K435DRAFT_794895 [Dendrothele bispora CBS 962.96]